MTEAAILYALSTIAQTCAALAALVGALAIYQINSLRDRHGFIEREIRALILLTRSTMSHHLTIEAVIRHARDLVANPRVDELEVRPRVDAALVEWDAFDKHFRRSKRLLAYLVAWNLLAVFISLVGFAFMYRVVNHWSSWAILWVVAGLTVVATGIMLLEVHGSLDRFRTCRGLGWILVWLETRHG